MKEPLAINLGDRVEMRKPHACGANRWTVLRTGIDIRIQCHRCRRTVLLPRTQFTRAVRAISPAESPAESDPAGRPQA